MFGGRVRRRFNDRFIIFKKLFKLGREMIFFDFWSTNILGYERITLSSLIRGIIQFVTPSKSAIIEIIKFLISSVGGFGQRRKLFLRLISSWIMMRNRFLGVTLIEGWNLLMCSFWLLKRKPYQVRLIVAILKSLGFILAKTKIIRRLRIKALFMGLVLISYCLIP